MIGEAPDQVRGIGESGDAGRHSPTTTKPPSPISTYNVLKDNEIYNSVCPSALHDVWTLMP